MIKKLWILLILALCLSVLLFSSALAEQSGQCGLNAFFVLDDEGVLTISGTGPVNNYQSQFDMYNFPKNSVTCIIIEDGITEIGRQRFLQWESLEYVSINGGTAIGEEAFLNCRNLRAIHFSDSITSIGENAFAGCSSLTSFTIPAGVTSVNGNILEGCHQLARITITSGLTSITGGFRCDSLTDFRVSDANPKFCAVDGVLFSKDKKVLISYPTGREASAYQVPDGTVGIQRGAFTDCRINSISLPASVTSVEGGAFQSSLINGFEVAEGSEHLCAADGVLYNAAKTELIAYPKTETGEAKEIPETVTRIGDYAFYECGKLTGIVLPSGLVSIGDYAFYGCRQVTSLYLPSSVTSVGDYAFRYCSGLTEINIPSGVTRIGDSTFFWCSGLTEINIPNGVTSIGKYAIAYCKGLTSITIPNSVTSIGSLAFAGCDALISVTLSSGLKKISDDMFLQCSSLTSVEIPKGVASIGESAFSGCANLSSILIPGSVHTIERSAFHNCSGLTTVTLEEGVNNIGLSVFSGCTSLTSIEFPDSVTRMERTTFNGCTNLRNVKLSNHLTECDFAWIFYGCSNLTSVVIPMGVDLIGYNSFTGCTNLTSVTIMNRSATFDNRNVFASVDASRFTIYSYAGSTAEEYAAKYGYTFEAIEECVHKWGEVEMSLAPTEDENGKAYHVCSICDGLENVEIPKLSQMKTLRLPAALTAIEEEAFAGLPVEAVIIPDNCTSIGNSAFMGCASLIYVRIPASVTEIAENAFDGCPNVIIDRTAE